MPDDEQWKVERTRRAADRESHARAIKAAGGMRNAIDRGSLPKFIDTTVSEALVMGLLSQSVKKFFTVFGHGSTEIAEVLRIYQENGLCEVFGLRNEIEASHAAAALNWITGEKAAVVTSIGPGALQAMAASLVAASDGLGVWYLLGDETTEDEGFNMQQIPHSEQELFLKLFSSMGNAYSLHTPLALPTVLSRGYQTTSDPYRAGPFFLLLPMNIQSADLDQFNLDEIPQGEISRMGAAGEDGLYEQAAKELLKASRVVVKVGGGARRIGQPLADFLDLVDGVVVTTPIASGAVPASNERCMFVGGSKGSICGNYAMENADLLVAVATRFVCQSDCSRTGYPRVQRVINFNNEPDLAIHYNKTIAFVGDAALSLERLNETLRKMPRKNGGKPSNWLKSCQSKRQEWLNLIEERTAVPMIFDPVWGKPVFTQPAVIRAALDWARRKKVKTIFDAGDVQANGFQLVHDDSTGQTFTETGASYMGFAVSALLATGIADEPFYALAVTGDGSFTMNPQILIDGVEHNARGCILLLDNRRMGAISGLQLDQYGQEFATHDSVKVDYLAWARAIKGVNALPAGDSLEDLLSALDQAFAYPGLTLIHVPVYFGSDPHGSLGVYGRWNVGNWSKDVQALRHKIGL